MRHISRRLTTVGITAAAALLAPAAPAALAAPGAGTAAPSVLVMTVTAGTPSAPGASRSAVLECGAVPGGDHPAAAAGCAALEADGLDFTAPPTLQVMCPDLVRPVTVTVTGVWRGGLVDYQRTYPNECQLHRATGVLFDF
jgi:hypothetical protein